MCPQNCSCESRNTDLGGTPGPNVAMFTIKVRQKQLLYQNTPPSFHCQRQIGFQVLMVITQTPIIPSGWEQLPHKATQASFTLTHHAVFSTEVHLMP